MEQQLAAGLSEGKIRPDQEPRGSRRNAEDDFRARHQGRGRNPVGCCRRRPPREAAQARCHDGRLPRRRARLHGLAPVAQDSGTLRGKRAIAGGRRALRHVLFQAALVASHHNPTLKAFADRLRRAGKPHKVVVTAVARKLIIVANALCKRQREWEPSHP